MRGSGEKRMHCFRDEQDHFGLHLGKIAPAAGNELSTGNVSFAKLTSRGHQILWLRWGSDSFEHVASRSDLAAAIFGRTDE